MKQKFLDAAMRAALMFEGHTHCRVLPDGAPFAREHLAFVMHPKTATEGTRLYAIEPYGNRAHPTLLGIRVEACHCMPVDVIALRFQISSPVL